jgi:uncharacterized protein (TIGR02266 family)
LANTDNRKSQRSPVTLRIKFKSATLEQFIERYAVDVSQGGIFIRTKEPLPVGTTMRFEFQLRDESPLITGEGTVVWIREQNAGQSGVAPGMGVRFDRLTESSQGVLDEILAHKAARGANDADSVDVPTRVVAAASIRKEHGPPMQFAPDAVPDEAFEQATKVHSLQELATLSARSDAGEQTRKVAAQELGINDYADSEDDKTKVYPALAKPAGRSAGPHIDLGTSGSTQPLPPMPGPQASDVELGRAGYEEDLDDDELPFDTRDARDLELGLAGPTAPLQHERLVRPDEVELGRAGTVPPASQARAAARPATPGKPIALGQSGAHDPMSDVPLPEAGHYDLGQAGPTMAMPAERLSRGAELELGAAGGTEVGEITAMLPAVRPDELARPGQRPTQVGAAAAARAPQQARPAVPAIVPVAHGAEDAVDDALDSLEETHDRLAPITPAAGVAAAQREASDELAARRARRDSERLPPAAGDEVAAAAEQPGDELAEQSGDEPGARIDDEAEEQTAAQAASAAAGGRARSAPIVRVSTARTGTEGVGGEKRSSFLPLLAAAVLVLIIGGGALYMYTGGDVLSLFTRGDGTTPQSTDPTVAQNPAPTPVEPPVTPPQPATAGANPDAGAAAAGGEPEIVFEDEPEVPVETVSVQVRSTPPGATAALVDGDQSGPTPMTFTVDKSKKHRVRISHPGFASQEIEVDPARPKPASVTLAPTPWVLRLESTPPGATVYVDGRRVVGHTPNEFALPRGSERRRQFKISFRLPGYDKLDIVVDNAFQAEGEAMVQAVQGTLAKRVAPVRPRPQPGPRPPAGGDQTTPPPDGTGQQGTQPPEGGTPPPGGDTQPPPPADPPKPETPPAGQGEQPPQQL